MRFLKIIFWILIAATIIVFSLRNWTPITINLWGNLVLDTRLPVPMLLAFLFGLIPMMIIHSATRWSLKRKLSNIERSAADQRAVAPPAAIPSKISANDQTPPIANPIAVSPEVL